MQRTLALLLLLFASSAYSGDLYLNNGRVLKEPRLKTRNKNVVTIMHSTGTGTSRIESFKKDSQAWFNGKLGRRYVGGIHPIDDDSLALARQLMDVFCTNRTASVQIADSTRNTVQKLPTDATPDVTLLKARKDLYSHYLASELNTNELQEILSIYDSPTMKKYRDSHFKIEPEVEAVMTGYHLDHPNKTAAFAKRLEFKSKTTGLYYIELEKMIDELLLEVQDELDDILSKHLTAEEIAELHRLEALDSYKRLSRTWMRDELTVPKMWKRFLRDNPEYNAALEKWWKTQK